MTKFMLMYRIASLRPKHPVLAIVFTMAYFAIFGSAAAGFTIYLLTGGALGPGLAVVIGTSWGVGMAPAMVVMPFVPAILRWYTRRRLPFLICGSLFVFALTSFFTASTIKALMPFVQSPLLTTIGVTLLPLGWLMYCTEMFTTFVIPLLVSMRVKRLAQDAMRAKSLGEFERLIEFCMVTRELSFSEDDCSRFQK